jgi:Flp pilus assembly protein TadG
VTRRLGATRPGRRGGGQATVELAIGFPVVLVGVLLVLQLALVGRDQLLVSHASREAARSAAVDPGPGAARSGALASTTGLDPDRLDVDVDHRAGRVRVRLTYRARTALPLVGPLVPDPVLRAEVTMHVEGVDPG